MKKEIKSNFTEKPIMTTNPRQIKACNLNPGTWYHSNKIVPPDSRQVLCCDSEGLLGFAHFDVDENLWTQNNYDSDGFLWQVVSRPLDFMFD